MTTKPNPVEMLADAPVPFTVTEAGDKAVSNLYPLPDPRPGHRFVPALIGRSTEPGVITLVECPTWCVVDHVASRSVFLEDLNHEGEHRAMSFTPSNGPRVPVEVYLSQWPGSHEPEPQLAVDLDCEVDTYGRTAALALADQLVAFAADVRRLAQTLPDEAPRCVRGEAV